jgi:hypothetical protein
MASSGRSSVVSSSIVMSTGPARARATRLEVGGCLAVSAALPSITTVAVANKSAGVSGCLGELAVWASSRALYTP